MNLFGRKSSPAAAKPAPESVETETPPAAVAPPPAEPAPVAPASAAMESPTAEPAAAPTDPAAAAQTAADAAAATAANTAARLAFLDKGTANMTSTPPKPPASFLPGGSLPGAAARSDQPRRTLDLPGAGGMGVSGLGASGLAGARRADEPAPTIPAAPPQPVMPAQRRLIVGRDISLAGEIASCDVLVVEGTVEAKLRDGHSVEITETGLFKGSVEIDDADIGGRFEGDLVVRNRLRVRSGGRIIGSIVYGELEVESGGRLEGSIKLYDPQPKVEVAAAPVAPPAPVIETAPAPVQAPVVEQSSGDVQPAQVYVPPTQSFNS